MQLFHMLELKIEVKKLVPNIFTVTMSFCSCINQYLNTSYFIFKFFSTFLMKRNDKISFAELGFLYFNGWYGKPKLTEELSFDRGQKNFP